MRDAPLIDKESNVNQINANDSDTDENIIENYNHKSKNKNETSSFVLDKISFYNYYYNNIYCKFCKKRRNQEILNSINDIIHEYLSIDNLLYNQIKLEHLFKDYNWNNPLLCNILNNEKIDKLKKI